MEQNTVDAAARAGAFGNGLRKNVTAVGRRWAQWPAGPHVHTEILACIDFIQQRLQAAAIAENGEAEIAACIADLRAILEWTTYQSGALATARALLFARKTSAFARRFNLFDERTPSLAILVDSEESLIESVQTRNGYMIAIAEKHPHLALPDPIADAASLVPKIERPPTKLAFIQQMMQSRKNKRP
jgi:hypothetical protein